MTKFSLGATKGTIDDDEFDMVDDILQVVNEYQQSVTQAKAECDRKILAIKDDTEKRLRDLKSELKIKLGIEE